MADAQILSLLLAGYISGRLFEAWFRNLIRRVRDGN